MRSHRLRNFLSNDDGASMVEVALILTLILLVAFPAIRTVGPRAASPICKANKVLEVAVAPDGHMQVATALEQSVMCCVDGQWKCLLNAGGPSCSPQQQVMCTGGSGIIP